MNTTSPLQSRTILERLQQHAAWVMGGVVILFLVLVALGAGGVRGSDQYWYIADVASLLRRDATTHHHFSRLLLTTHPALAGGPFVHNDLLLYLALPFGLVFGAYGGFIATNAVLMILTALVAKWIVDRLVGVNGAGLLVFALSLLSPLTIWLTVQPLAEAGLALGIVGCAAGFLWRDQGPRYIFAYAVAASYLYLSRSSFLPVLAMAPVVAVLGLYGWRKSAIATERHGFTPLQGAVHFTISVIVVVLSVWTRKTFFIQSMPGGLRNIIMNRKMDFMMRVSDPAFAPSRVMEKAVGAAQNQFLSELSQQLFYLPFNAMVVVCIVSLFSKNLLIRRLALLSVGLIALHIVVGVLHQVQFRYLFIPWIPLLILTVVTMRHGFSWGRLMAIGVAGAVGMSLALSVVGALKSRKDGTRAQKDRTALRAALDPVAGTQPLLICTGKYSIEMAYTFRDRPVVEFDPGQLREEELGKLLRQVPANVAVCEPAQWPRPEEFGFYPRPTPLPKKYGTAMVYQRLGAADDAKQERVERTPAPRSELAPTP